MKFDSSGNAHIALLLNSTAPEGHATTLVARTSFDRNGRPRLDSGTIYHENAETPSEPRGGAISLYVDDNGGPWYIDWCVLLDDNSFLASSRIATASLKTGAGYNLPASSTAELSQQVLPDFIPQRQARVH